MAVPSLRTKKAQVTIFIIIGILMLFAFLFVMWLTTSVKTTQLEEGKEKIITKTFKKEALRLYVEDCLTDELKKGLILLGKQGKIWEGQPGGSKIFNNGKNGITFAGEQVFYGITSKNYLKFQNAYPCKNDSFSPEFCQYVFAPNKPVALGVLELKTSTIEEDLEAYLINRTIWCVENFTKSNISSQAKVESTEMTLKLTVEKDGMNVRVDYPLKFTLGKEEFFQLSTFDFFYPSQFGKLLDAAVTYPLERDYRFGEFIYTEEFLKSAAFTYNAVYKALGITLDKQELANGDNIFTFTPALYTVLDEPTLYSFRIARQNRPPALDYVNRYNCTTNFKPYDYLVIKDDPEMGSININLQAIDADEDTVSYAFSDVPAEIKPAPVVMGPSAAANVPPNVAQPPAPAPQTNILFVPTEQVSLLPSAIYKITAAATDEHGLKDWQEVRVLIDNPVETKLSLSLPYNDLNTYEGIASVEDPAFIKVTYPGDSIAGFQPTLTFSYVNEPAGESFEFTDFGSTLGLSSATKEKCLSLPSQNSLYECKLEAYKDKIDTWNQLLQDATYGHFQKTGSGTLTLLTNLNYCGGLTKEDSTKVDVKVKECVPHRNPTHPYAYTPEKDYHNYKFGLDADGKTDFGAYKGIEDINPLEANHACCSGDVNDPSSWKWAPSTEVCYRSPQPGCYGKITGYTTIASNKGYLLEEEQLYCSGNRGNVCDGKGTWEFWKGQMICGKNGKDSCANIKTECQELPAFSLIKDKGWCFGKMGCGSLCVKPKAVVNTLNTCTACTSEFINAEALKLKPSSDKDFYFKCGCDGTSTTSGKPCDTNFDGNFGGICKGNECVGDV